MATDFNQITFDNRNHTYKCGSQLLLSVTSLIDRIKPIFDKEGVSARLAERENRSQKEILKEWERSGEESRDKGTRVHSYIEDVIEGKTDLALRQVNDRIPEMDAFDEAWLRMKSSLGVTLIEKEKIVGDVEFGVAGRTDAIMEFAGEPCIFDWKTGKKFDESNHYERLLPPFESEDSCQLNAYSIQVSLYRLMIERNTDMKMGNPYLLHLRPNGTFHLYRAKDYRTRLEAWLKNGLPEEFTSDPAAEKETKSCMKKLDELKDLLPKLSQKTAKECSKATASFLKSITTTD
jgi:hypothetical protein